MSNEYNCPPRCPICLNLHYTTISCKTPIIIGVQYSPISQDWPNMILESADLKSDFIRLKDPESPFIFESNYATFSVYWKKSN